jgi:hypothetical protein
MTHIFYRLLQKFPFIPGWWWQPRGRARAVVNVDAALLGRIVLGPANNSLLPPGTVSREQISPRHHGRGAVYVLGWLRRSSHVACMRHRSHLFLTNWQFACMKSKKSLCHAPAHCVDSAVTKWGTCCELQPLLSTRRVRLEHKYRQRQSQYMHANYTSLYSCFRHCSSYT